MKALPMKTNVSVVVVVALTQLLGMMLFFEEVSAGCSQRQMIIDRRGGSALEQSLPRGGPHNSLHVSTPPSSLKGGWQTLGTHPDPYVPTPPQQHTVHSTVEASAASKCPPSSKCNGHVPTPGCPCSPQSKEEQQAKVNGEEFMRNYRTSITTGKYSSTDHINTRFLIQ